MAEQIDRRTFVRLGVCTGAGLAVTGLSGCAPSTSDTEPVEKPSYTFGEESEMARRILVGYATGKGSTVGVAEEIGKVLANRGNLVDVKPMREIRQLDGYDAFVLGSAVNGGKWLPEAVQFVGSNAETLKAAPVAAFSVHMMNAGTDAKQTQKRLAYLDDVRAVVKPADEAYFLGKMDDMGLVARVAFKAFGGAGEGDCRDWYAIRAWAEGLQL